MINYELMKEQLYSAVIADILDDLGYRHQAMRFDIRPLKEDDIVAGPAFTCLAADCYKIPDEPYKYTLVTVDSISEGEVLCATTNGSTHSGFWGELLTTVAQCRGAVGAVIDGFSRDTRKIKKMNFPLFHRGWYPLDSNGRVDVIAYGVPIECGGVLVNPGDIIFGDFDGILVIPKDIAEEVIEKALEKVNGENIVRSEILKGRSAADVYNEYHIL